ncbi:MAG: hypothetical protein BWY47_00433 [Bacteroidetes bacterium ADurb.Bin302]|jgi:hypothetical protein|nr:MAG: hypothetical protein BWY47_00433 [Bacteroidetes bacterium ADurb.Bin302]
MDKKIYFEYEYLPTIEDVHQHIKNCEGKHSQQTAFSTFHDALTQVCFGCRKIRSTIKMEKKNEKRKRVYIDVGSHGGIFEFIGGNIAERYPTLLHVYNKKISKNLKAAVIVYKI